MRNAEVLFGDSKGFSWKSHPIFRVFAAEDFNGIGNVKEPRPCPSASIRFVGIFIFSLSSFCTLPRCTRNRYAGRPRENPIPARRPPRDRSGRLVFESRVLDIILFHTRRVRRHIARRRRRAGGGGKLLLYALFKTPSSRWPADNGQQ